VLLHAQLAHLRAGERRDEIVLVEREAEMVDAGKLPLARLDDDVDGAALELRQAQLEAHAVEVVPAVPGLEGRSCPRRCRPWRATSVKAELADVARSTSRTLLVTRW
jgi:hypothetical protein